MPKGTRLCKFRGDGGPVTLRRPARRVLDALVPSSPCARQPRMPASQPCSPAMPAAPATPDDLFALLDRLGIAHRTVGHPPLFTVEQSRALRGQIPGGHTKNLFLKDKKGALVLVVALEDAVIELKSLHRRLGAGGRFSFGSAELLREALGVEPGAVTPFAVMNDTERRVDVVLDTAMLAHAALNDH